MKKYLVTGGLGFIGSNISKSILKKKGELIILDNFSRIGSKSNLKWLKKFGKFRFYDADIRNPMQVEKIVKKKSRETRKEETPKIQGATRESSKEESCCKAGTRDTG